jgi:hypothetical protein
VRTADPAGLAAQSSIVVRPCRAGAQPNNNATRQASAGPSQQTLPNIANKLCRLCRLATSAACRTSTAFEAP